MEGDDRGKEERRREGQEDQESMWKQEEGAQPTWLVYCGSEKLGEGKLSLASAGEFGIGGRARSAGGATGTE